jgi:hypothetical protein
VAAKSGKGTARQSLRLPEGEWDEFGAACQTAGTDRSAYLRDVIRWAVGRPGVKAPKRLPKETTDG